MIPASLRRQRAAHLSACALAVGVAVLVYAQTRRYGLLGMDSYPIILTSRVGSPADLWGNFSERLMDGLYPGAFYRPLLNLSFALDHALWGLDAAGYQLSNVLYYAAAALALYLLLVARPTRRPPVFALAGMVFFLFHPLLFEVVPFPPRRSELLCSAFLLLALASETRGGRKFRLLGGAATVLALMAKETAVILPALVFCQRWLSAQGLDFRQRVLAAGRRAFAPGVAVAAYLAVRLAVLGGLGGRGELDPAQAIAALPNVLSNLSRTVASPRAPESWAVLGIWVVLGLLLLLLPSAGRRSTAEPIAGPDSGRRQAVRSDLLLAAGWLGILSVVYALSGRLSPWYAVLAVVGFAIAFAGLLEGCGRWLSRDSMAYRAVGLIGLAALLMLCFQQQLRWSPVVRPYRLWQRATTEDALLLQRFGQLLEQTPDGSLTQLTAEHKKIKGGGEAAMFQGVVLLSHYSLQAWAALAYPQRQVRVLKNRRPLKTEPLKASEVVVILDRQPKSKSGPSGSSRLRQPVAAKPHEVVDNAP